jgi:hypothetical protein
MEIQRDEWRSPAPFPERAADCRQMVCFFRAHDED